MTDAALIFDIASLTNVEKLWADVHQDVAPRFGPCWDSVLADALPGQSLDGATRLIASCAGLSPAQHREIRQALLTEFRTRVVQRHLERQELVDVLLADAKSAGVPVGVISTILPHDEVTYCLERTRLRDHVRAVQCGDRGFPVRTTPHLHRAVLATLKAHPSGSVAIEHTSNGMASAKAADVYVVSDPTIKRPTCANGHIGAYNEPGLLAQLLHDAADQRLF